MTPRSTTRADDGLVRVRSPLGQAATLARILASLAKHHVPLAALIDHAAAARAVGLSLPKTDLLIFGNPALGTPLMNAQPLAAIDLPLKLLVQEASDGSWLTFNDPNWIARRHGLSPSGDSFIAALGELLATIASEATAPIVS